MDQIKKRKISVCVLLSIITFGIYGMYWMYILVKDTRSMQDKDGKCIGEFLCLLLVPFYSLYWWYTRGDKIKKISKEQDYNAKSSGWLHLILAFFGLDIISMAIMQNDINYLATGPYVENANSVRAIVAIVASLFLLRWSFVWGGMIILFLALIWQCTFWGSVTRKVLENKGYSEDWFFWGFFFGIIAFALAVSKPDCPRKQAGTNDQYYKELLAEGGWGCEKCGRANPAYTGTCSCGNHKPSSEEA